MVNLFEINKIYNRRQDIHAIYGGNQQSGIVPCRDHPYIFLFSINAGGQHGYEDGWDEENYFHYTGEGQKGDMIFAAGNKAIRDHQINGNFIYLFEGQGRGLWKYIDQLELINFALFQTPDTSGQMRTGIKFKFNSATERSINKQGQPRIPSRTNKPDKTERKGLVISRVGQGWYRDAVLAKWNSRCAVIECDIKEVLIASHIVPWRESNDEERLDPENGILLSPNLDALFDRHLISFADDGSILIGTKLNSFNPLPLGLSEDLRLRMVTTGMKKYLVKHRAIFHENN